MVFVLLGIVRLKLGNLSLKGGGIGPGFLQGFQLSIPFSNRGLGRFQFLVYLIEAGLGHKRTVQALHNLVRLFFSQAHFHQFFLCHS